MAQIRDECIIGANQLMPMLPTIRTSCGVVQEQIPSDLREWVDGNVLACCILELQQSLESAVPATARCKIFSALLTYCYAIGLLGTDDIVEAFEDNAMLRCLSARTLLDAATLRQFRRYNRGQIETMLARLFARVWQEHRQATVAVAIPWPPAVQAAHHNVRQAPDFLSEARDRVLDAIRLDSMALDY